MGPACQISEIKTEAFSSNKREKFGFYGVFRGKNTDCLLRKSLCCVHIQFSKELDVERSVNMLSFT